MAKSAHHRIHQTPERHRIHLQQRRRGIHQPMRLRSGSLDLASRYRLLRAIPSVMDLWGVQQHVIGVDHCIKRRSARCPTARSLSSIIACRTEPGNSSQQAINSRSSDQFATLWISNASDSSSLSKSRSFPQCFPRGFASLLCIGVPWLSHIFHRIDRVGRNL